MLPFSGLKGKSNKQQASSSTLKMETVRSSEMLVIFYETTRRHVPGDSTLHRHCRQNLGSNMLYLLHGRSLRISMAPESELG
jgi:hypothetical protein